MYQINSGVLVQRRITPNTPIRFFQPSCQTGTPPCDPKTRDYQGKRYFMLGRERKSTYTEHEFTLDLPFDFLGVPLEPKFCGNTINVNTVSFRQYIEFLGKSHRRNLWQTVGIVHRNVEIDTRTVPQYNDADLNQFRAKDKASKRERKASRLDDTEAVKCEPESDRISIDELTRINPVHGQVTINTGAGKDVLMINGMVGNIDYSNKDFLVADLGADGNMLSIGVALGFENKRDKLVAGVWFDNSYGKGQVCYLKGDFMSTTCVGNVKHVTIFKGSR